MHPPKRMQVVCDDIDVGILNLLHKIITLPSSEPVDMIFASNEVTTRWSRQQRVR